MLEPDVRAILTEQLRPPADHRLVHAVGTTFTLDLTSLLAVPLAFAGRLARESNDPVAILESLRRHSDRIDVFCQAGMIGVPARAADLMALLEQTVHPVVARRSGGLFHPKVWVLEYEHEGSRSYRMLCGSRNLTGDTSWDLVVRLDGSPTDDLVESSAPLADFVQALAPLSLRSLPRRRHRRLLELADRLRFVSWEPPTDISAVHFHPMGIDDRAPVDLDGKRHLVVSPFLSDEGIALMTAARSTSIDVVSRAESFDRLRAETLARIHPWVLNEAAVEDEVDGSPTGLHGLHAKAVVLDRQSGSRVVTGSANATGAAHHQNVEFMVELIGPQPRVGVGAVFGDDSPFRKLVDPYVTAGGVEPTEDELLDRALDDAIRRLATTRLRLDVSGSGPYAIRLTVLEGSSSDERPVEARLLTTPALPRALPQPGESTDILGLDITELTPFVVLRIEDARGVSRETVVLAELRGDVEGRIDSVLAKQLDSPEKFLRFLLLLLELPGGEMLAGDGSGGDLGFFGAASAGIFEALVRSFGAESTGLADLGRIIDRLRRSGDRQVLPDGFEELWDVLVEARAIEGASQ